MTQAADGAAPEGQSEFDRLWQTFDSLNSLVQDIDSRLCRVSREQQAPSPDYRMGEPFGELTQPGVDGPCSCEEAVALRAEVERLQKDVERRQSVIDTQAEVACHQRAENERLRSDLNAANSTLERWREGRSNSETLPRLLADSVVGLMTHAERSALDAACEWLEATWVDGNAGASNEDVALARAIEAAGLMERQAVVERARRSPPMLAPTT